MHTRQRGTATRGSGLREAALPHLLGLRKCSLTTTLKVETSGRAVSL
jgi:hypothetical protein